MKAKKVASLVPLQELDKSIYEYNRKINQAPNEVEEAKRKLQGLESDIETSKKSIVDIELKKKNYDLEIAEIDKQITKIRNHITTTKKMNNDEYQSFLKQISGHEADKKVVEDKWLETEMEADQIRKSVKLKQSDIEEVKREIEDKTKESIKEVEELSHEKKQYEEKRDDLLKGIDKELLDLYSRVLNSETTDGVALAQVLQQPKKKKATSLEDFIFTCEGCSVQLTMQDVNSVLMGTEINQCRNCSRILYLSEQFQTIQ